MRREWDPYMESVSLTVTELSSMSKPKAKTAYSESAEGKVKVKSSPPLPSNSGSLREDMIDAIDMIDKTDPLPVSPRDAGVSWPTALGNFQATSPPQVSALSIALALMTNAHSLCAQSQGEK